MDLSAAAEAAGLPIVEEVAAPAPAPESAAGGRVTDEELAAYGNESCPTDTSEEAGSRTAATSRPSTGTSRADGSVASGAAAGLSDEELGAFLAANAEAEAKRPRSSSPVSDAELDAYIAAGTSESKQSDPPAAAPAGDDLEAHGRPPRPRRSRRRAARRTRRASRRSRSGGCRGASRQSSAPRRRGRRPRGGRRPGATSPASGSTPPRRRRRTTRRPRATARRARPSAPTGRARGRRRGASGASSSATPRPSGRRRRP